MADKESSVKKLEKKLYSKQNTIELGSRKHFSQADSDIQRDWIDTQETAPKAPEEPVKKRKPMTGFTKLLLLAIGFFLVSMAGAFAVFSLGQNTSSYDRVNLSVLGPNAIPGGEVLSYDVIIQNDNEVDIVLTDIIVTYPNSSFDPQQDGVALTKEIRSVDTVARGTSHTEKFQTVFFGDQGDVQDIKITYEYRVPDSNAILFKERIYQVQLESSPVSLVVDAPQESLSGEDIEISVEIISNSNQTIDDLFLQIDYPFGFKLSESDPTPEENQDNLFRLGTLEVGETRIIKLIGTISGQDDEQRVFRYRMGLFDEQAGQISNTLQQIESIIAIQKPPVTLALKINGTIQDRHVFDPDETVDVVLEYLTNLASRIDDAVITAKVTGSAFSEQTISTDGFYDSAQDTIVWQKTDIPELAAIEAGARSDVQARWRLFSTEQMAGRVVDPFVSIEYQLTGSTFDFENNEKPVVSKGTARIVVPTEMSFASRVVHSLGQFENTTPIQLTADQESTYTVVWQILNSTSQVENAQVEATLPPYVQFVQAEEKAGHTITYDEQARKITWSVQEVAAGAGYGTTAPEITFQVAVTPSVSQVGSNIAITQDQVMRGFDTFAEIARLYNLPGENSESLKTDPNYNGSANVVSAGQ